MTILELIENLQSQYDNMGEDATVWIQVPIAGATVLTRVVDVNELGDLIVGMGMTE